MGKITTIFALTILVLSGCSAPSQEAANPEPSPAFKAGDVCENPAEEVQGSEGILLCTFNIGQGWTWIPLTGSGVFPGQNELAQLPIDKCKIKDNRPPEVRYFGATGFPAPESRMPNKGEVTVAIIPIDFPDALGVTDPMSLIRKDLEAIDAWTEFFTDGSVKYNWVFSDEWLTMPKESKYYVWDKSYISDGEFFKMSDKQLQSNQKQATQVFSAAEKVQYR
jgi:hypothetical protein